MKEKDFNIHLIGIYSLFLLGEASITQPFGLANEYTLLGFLSASVLGIGVLCVLTPIVKMCTQNHELGYFKRTVLLLIYIAVISLCVLVMANCFNRFSNFISIFVLPETPKMVIALLFLALIIYLSCKPKTVFYKLGLLAFVFSFLIVLIIFLISIPQFDVENIIVLTLPRFNSLIKQMVPYAKNIMLCAVILPFYQSFVAKNNKKSLPFYGTITGIIMMSFILLNSILIFGNELAGKIEYPYSEAIGTVTIGNIFTRMDGFSYFVFFSSCLIKICICIMLIIKLSKKGYNLLFLKA